jgi:hypothetical protein
MIDRVSFERPPMPPPTRFEAGTLAIVEAIGFGAAVDYVQSIGLEAIHAHEAALVRHLRRELAAMNDVRLFGPEDPPASSALRWKVHPHDLGTIWTKAPRPRQRGDPRGAPLRPAADGAPWRARHRARQFWTLQRRERHCRAARRD